MGYVTLQKSLYVTTLPGFVVLGIVVVEIVLF